MYNEKIANTSEVQNSKQLKQQMLKMATSQNGRYGYDNNHTHAVVKQQMYGLNPKLASYILEKSHLAPQIYQRRKRFCIGTVNIDK